MISDTMCHAGSRQCGCPLFLAYGFRPDHSLFSEDGPMLKSYSRTTLGILPRIREGFALWRYHSADASEQVRGFLESMGGAQATIERLLGEDLRGKDIFEIGPGQLVKNARYFGAHNHVVAIDLDKVVEQWDFGAWLQMLRTNGPLRVGKTLARKMLGID